VWGHFGEHLFLGDRNWLFRQQALRASTVKESLANVMAVRDDNELIAGDRDRI
jgi:hypothetical protein